MTSRSLLCFRTILGACLVVPGLCGAAAPAREEGAKADTRMRAQAALLASMPAGVGECAHCRLIDADPGARAPSTRPFDESTGRSLLNYPPHRVADFRHMKLELDIEDMNTPSLRAVQTLTLTPVGGAGRAMEELALDARLMTIESVESQGQPAVFRHDGRTLTVAFDPPVPDGQSVTLVTRYTLTDPPMGLIWTPESPAWPGRPAQIHTQGQPETNSYWFPCHDFPNERLTTELIVSVPVGYTVCSNGRLASFQKGVRVRSIASGSESLIPRDLFHWVQDRSAAPGNNGVGGEHVNYLVSLVVGKFDVVEVGQKPVKITVYVPPGRGPDVRGTFGRTPEMMSLFGRLFDEPYPWAKYSQAVVWNYGGGGMENTSATTLYDTAILSKQALLDQDLDGLISHELAHQWFGDLVTCNSWEHVWLNEGFATYLTSLWYEASKPPYGGPDVYQSQIRGNFDAVIASDKPEAPFQPAMVSKVYEHPFEAFRRAANPYSKGSSVLHMLRRKLGDDAFFKGVALFIDRFKNKTVETSDLRKAFEEVSGESLEQFFNQWCMRPGVPTLTIDIGWTPDTPTLSGLVKGTLRVTVDQTQNIDAYNPAFAFTLPVGIVAPSGAGGKEIETRWLTIDVREKTTSAEIVLDGEPRVVAVDPDLCVLAGMAITQPVERWLNQLRDGPTYAARVQAARALGTSDAQAGGDELLRVAMHTASPAALRIEAIRALGVGGRKDAARVETTSMAQLTPPQVRAAALESAAALGAQLSGEAGEAGPRFRARAVEQLRSVYRTDRAMKTRAAALTGLGALKAMDQLPLILGAADVESQDDMIRQAALEAMAALNTPDGLVRALGFTQPGTLSRTRAKAIEVAVRLASPDREKVFSALVSLLNDREFRTRMAARQGLADLGDPRGVAELEKLAGGAPGDGDRVHARQMLYALRRKLATPDRPADK